MPTLQAPVLEYEERSLLSAVARGEDAAVDRLYGTYSEAVMRFIYRRVEERFEDAQEITLDTFVTAVNLAGGFDPRSSLYTWLCGIAKVRIVDFYRKKDRAKRVPHEMIAELTDLQAGAVSLDFVLDRIDASRVVDAMLGDLNDDEREAILLRYVEGHSVREAAQLMNRSEKGVESLLTRAKSKARGALERWKLGGEA